VKELVRIVARATRRMSSRLSMQPGAVVNGRERGAGEICESANSRGDVA